VTNAAGLDLEAQLKGARPGNFAFNNFKRSAGAVDLGSAHLGHKFCRLNPRSEDAKNLAGFCPLTTGNFSARGFNRRIVR
jgi:hypothetical protein